MVAVGGYGRAEMAPHSDVDLLFLLPWKATGWIESVIESMLYMFWDMHLKVGHATRSIAENIRLAREDTTIRTALLEHRPLIGNRALTKSLKDKLWSELFRNTGAAFIEAKLEERAKRHERQGGQRYVVEPNVKEGKGGLRDLQTLYWIAKYLNRVETVEQLVPLGMFSPEEYATFAAAEDFLLTVRCQLHLIADRAMDQLTFDLQVEVAERLGYTDHGGRRAVEHFFMQDYFRHATKVGELTPNLPDRTGSQARQIRTDAGWIFSAAQKNPSRVPDHQQSAKHQVAKNVSWRQTKHAQGFRGSPAHRLTDPP